MCNNFDQFEPYKQFTLKQANYIGDHPGVCFTMCLDWFRRKLKTKKPKLSFRGQDEAWLKSKYVNWKGIQDHIVAKQKTEFDAPVEACVKTLQWVLTQPTTLAKFTPEERVTMTKLLGKNAVELWKVNRFKNLDASEADQLSDLWYKAEKFPECVQRLREETVKMSISQTKTDIEYVAVKYSKFEDLGLDLDLVVSAAFEYDKPPGVWQQIATVLDPELKDKEHLLMIGLYGFEKKPDGVIKTAMHATALHYWKQKPQRFHFLDPNYHEYNFSDRAIFALYLDTLWKEKEEGYGNFTWEQWAAFKCFV